MALLCPASVAGDRAFAAGHITEPDPEWEGAAHFALSDNLIAPGYHIKDSLAGQSLYHTIRSVMNTSLALQATGVRHSGLESLYA